MLENDKELIKYSTEEVIGERAFENKRELTSIELPNTLKRIEKYAFSECRGLRSIEIPSSVTSIGDHSFYNCRQLEKIALSSEISNIGDGAFKNCNGLKEITFLLGEKNVAFKKVIPEVSGDITVKIVKNGKVRAKIFFPKDNVFMSDFSTRLYMDVRYGVGNHYRQAIGREGLDYGKYDSLFPMAINELAQEAVIQIAVDRICFPEQLEEEHANSYMEYLKNYNKETCSFLWKAHNLECFMYLLQRMNFSKEIIEEMITLAYEEKETEAAGYLLEYKHQHFNKRDIVFEL